MINDLKDIISGDRMHRNTLIPGVFEDFIQKSTDELKKKKVSDFSSKFVTSATIAVAALVNFLNYKYSDVLKRTTPAQLGKIDNPFLITKDTPKIDVERMFKLLSAHYLIVLISTNENSLKNIGITGQKLETDFYKILDFTSDEKKIFVAMKNDMQRKSEFYFPRLFEYVTGKSAYDDENLLHAIQLGETLNIYYQEIFKEQIKEVMS